MQQLAIDLTAIREILAQHGRLSEDARLLKADHCLHDAGLTSLATVSVMLALEDEFDVEFPDSLLRKGTFQSVAAIREALTSLGVVIAPG